jgi:hypothetical protein
MNKLPGLPERIALIGTSIPSGGSVLCVHLRRFLELNGIEVDFFDAAIYTLRFHQKQRNDQNHAKLPLLRGVLQDIASHISKRNYQVIIATEREEIFLENLPKNSRKFYYCCAPLAYERYYGWLQNDDPDAEIKLRKLLEIENNIYQNVDVITFAWNTYEKFVREQIYDGNNITTHPGLGWYGCEPCKNRVEYKPVLNLIYLGFIDYWSNPALLKKLTELAPFPIHCYGRSVVPIPGIDHFGHVPDEWKLLDRYHIGLNTVSTDPLRIAGFSSKVLNYLSVGMPVFSPNWQEFSHQVEGIIPFEEENFVELAEKYHEPEAWQELSNAAYMQAQELQWQKVLTPFLDLLTG